MQYFPVMACAHFKEQPDGSNQVGCPLLLPDNGISLIYRIINAMKV
jgi:hypothetical protein